LYVNHLYSKDLLPCLADVKTDGFSLVPEKMTSDESAMSISAKRSTKKDSASVIPSGSPNILQQKSPNLVSHKPDTVKLVPINSYASNKTLNELVVKNNFAKNIMGHLLTSQGTNINAAGVQSISYFNLFSGKKIASIRFVRLHPFGSSIHDTTLVATRWMEKAGNRLHMNTVKSKLRMQLLFQTGETVNPLLMAENEKVMRDLNYIEDVSFRLEPIENAPDEVNVVIISKDKFEYGVNLSVNKDNSDLEVINENMFGMGHRLTVGMAQKNEYLPEMGIYSSYHVNNILGKFINSTIGFSDTYIKKDWNFSVEKKFLTSKEVNVGGFSFDHVAKFNYIAEDHPIELDTTVAYVTDDLWFAHAFPGTKNLLNKTILSCRYYHQEFDRRPDDSFGDSEFLRNHDSFLAGVGFSKRNLYKNNLVYGYGVTEDIPYGHYFEIKGGLDKSQFGVWPYLGFSLNHAFISPGGNYYSGQAALDGFLDDGSIKQGTLLLSSNFFTKKFYAFGDPFRQFLKIELLDGINRFKEEYLTIDNHFGIRDFHTNDLKGKCRLKVNLETVRYLKWNFYGFKFTNYLYGDFAFLSDKLKSIFSQDFYAGIGVGLRIYNESLIFKIIDIRLSWFPILPPEGMNPFALNLQGTTKSGFDDFLGRKLEVIRYQ
jgi:hypothetical protein